MKFIYQKQTGLTLIELLVVIAISAILIATVVAALDPVTRFVDARNSQRWTDINNYLTSIHEYIVDNNKSLPIGLTTNMRRTQIGTCTAGGAILCPGAAKACVNLSLPLAKYLKSLPKDPNTGTTITTGYSVSVGTNNLITVSACSAENNEIIQMSR